MRRVLPAFGLALLISASPPVAFEARAQDRPASVATSATDRAALVADRVYLDGNDLLKAEGAVEVFYRGTRLRAARVVYDSRGDSLTIDGPIEVQDGRGTVILADQALMSADLTEGILTSARMVLQDQIQLAANAIVRSGGRYTQLDRVVASACQICPGRPTPLWEIRARRVTHDSAARQLYFDHATLRVVGLPVVWLPRLRLPDPTLDRASGFLPAKIRTTSQLGTGIKIPYFIALGDSRDLTVTPYVSSAWTRTLGLRYRQAFRSGRIELEGALTRDSILPDRTRGYFFGRGTFALPDDYRLGLHIETVTDNGYLLDYGLGDYDWLTSGFTLDRVRRDGYVQATLYNYHSIRAGDRNMTLPTLVSDVTWRRRFSPQTIGGTAGIELMFHGQRRTSDVSIDANADGTIDGRDIARGSIRLDWQRSWTFGPGLVGTTQARLRSDIYRISQDATYPGTVMRSLPTLAAELRWPLVRERAGGATEVLEPVAQLVWSPNHLRAVPDEDSVLVEFDEGNLFSLDRFPGADRQELGLRANLGLTWTRQGAAGNVLRLGGGRVLRARNLGQFSPGTGLDGRSSDWLVAGDYLDPSGLYMAGRLLFSDDLDFAKQEFLVSFAQGDSSLAASYVRLPADPALDRFAATSELTVDGGWRITDTWLARAGARYDFETDSAARARLGLQWRTDCATVDLSLSRRFTSSTTVQATTDFDLSVQLAGWGGGPDGRRIRRSCGP